MIMGRVSLIDSSASKIALVVAIHGGSKIVQSGIDAFARDLEAREVLFYC